MSKKSTNNIKDEYNKRGYVLSKTILNEIDSDSLRKYIKNFIRENPKSEKNIILHSKCVKAKEIYKVLFNDKINKVLKKIFGNNYEINQFEVQYNSFPLIRDNGFHYDAQSERNNSYLKNQDYMFGKVGVYLQDNTNDFGGGIDVIPYSHKIFPVKFLRLELFLRKKLLFLRKKINTKKGDAIVFDSRLLHTGTQPVSLFKDKNTITLRELNSQISGNDKIAIYWNVCVKKCSSNYLKNSIDRCIKHELKRSDHKYYSDHLRLHYPSDYSSDFINQCTRKNIKVATLSKETAHVIGEIYNIKKNQNN